MSVRVISIFTSSVSLGIATDSFSSLLTVMLDIYLWFFSWICLVSDCSASRLGTRNRCFHFLHSLLHLSFDVYC
jgi:hypothetical protein